MYTLYNNGINNGLNDLKILNKHSIKQIEPHILGDMGIFIKNTGILDVHELMKSFLIIPTILTMIIFLKQK